MTTDWRGTTDTMIRHGDTAMIPTATGHQLATDAPSVQELLGVCDSCARRPAGHGHWALYCLPCSELPYGAVAQ